MPRVTGPDGTTFEEHNPDALAYYRGEGYPIDDSDAADNPAAAPSAAPTETPEPQPAPVEPIPPTEESA